MCVVTMKLSAVRGTEYQEEEGSGPRKATYSTYFAVETLDTYTKTKRVTARKCIE